MKRLRSTVLAFALAGLVWSIPACGDDPFDITWVSDPDTVLLHSASLPDLNLPAAFDFIGRRRVIIEAPGSTGAWDLLLDTRDGELVFLTPEAVGIDSEAGIAVFPGLTFFELEEAPADSASYATLDPVVAEVGSTYVIRTREGRGAFSQLCIFFGKFEPVEVDPVGETVSFVFDVNPDCDDRVLVPDQEPM